KGALKAEEVLIADGHHRYETAWNYAQERLRQDRAASTRRRAYRYVLTFLCPLSDSGLVIQPTHRAVSVSMPWEEWQRRIEPVFTMQKMESFTELLARVRAGREPSALGFVMEGGRLAWLKPKSPDTAMPVVPLHEKILAGVPLEAISYGQDPREMVQHLQRGESSVVFLLPPPDKEAFARICRSGRLLPQKSTYFYPKLGTGFLMRSLDGDL